MEGNFVDGIRDGFCKYTYQNGDVYEGYWKNGVKEGKGFYKYLRSGDFFEGIFENNKKSGYGEYRYGNGDYYQGEFRNGKRHG